MNQDYDNLASATHSDHPVPCALCHRFLPDNEAGDLPAVTICGDCKFLLLEGAPAQEDYQTMIRGLRLRRRHMSSESIEDLFSRQFSNVINQARQNQATVFDNDNLTIPGDATLLVQHAITRTTPSSSRRWRRVFSDTESDGFDSFFGESESNFSFNSSRFFHDENDVFSIGAYEEESNASVDDNTFLENEDYGHPYAVSGNETDNDIDPMHAGPYHGNSDDLDLEEEDVDEYIGWEENTVASVEPGVQPEMLYNALEMNVSNDRQHAQLLQLDNTAHLRIQERTRGTFANVFANLDEHAERSYIQNPGDYLRARGFEELLEHLAEAENSRRGAPPAALSFVRNLPNLVLRGEPDELDGLVCAICKDSLPVGTVVNQLPCFHLYHPPCILPWLSARNSCPLCRYELPTDDKDYEDRKQRDHMVLNLQELQQQNINEDSTSDETSGAEGAEQFNVNLFPESSSRENGRRGWVFLAAAAPFVGVFIVLCLGNRITERRWRNSQTNFGFFRRHPSCLASGTLSLRDSGQNRTWRFLF